MRLYAMGRKRVATLGLLLPVSCIYGRGVCLQHWRDQQLREPYGLFTVDTVLTRVQRINRLLSTLPTTTEAVAHRNTIHCGERPFRTWEVDCHDRAGEHYVGYLWEADSGQLLLAFTGSLDSGPARPPVGHPIGCRMAVSQACYWLECLGCGPRNEWQLIGTPERNPAMITLLLFRGGQRMLVQVSTRDGSFCSARRAKTPGETLCGPSGLVGTETPK